MNVDDINRIVAAFNKAHEIQCIQTPKMRLYRNGKVFTISRAPDNGSNPGALYVKDKGFYLGKIVDGKFWATSNLPKETWEDIIYICSHPFDAAVAYGRAYNRCSCCERMLTNPESVALGIGPICRDNFF
jgi:Family of unknown function (DUF6011)